MLTTGESECKGSSCLASQIEVAEQGVMVVRPSLGDKPGCNFFVNVKKTDADSHTDKRKQICNSQLPLAATCCSK